MTDVLTFIVIGLTTGSVYALTALGLVLTYKTSGVFNFAHGALAAAAAFVFYEAREINGLPWPVAALIALLLVGVLGGLLLERLADVLSRKSVATRVVATVGLLIGIQGLLVIRYGSAAKPFARFLPTRTVRLPGVSVGIDQMLVVAFAAATVGGLFWFFRRAPLGVAMMGVVDDASLLSLQGRNPSAVRRWAWVIGSVFAGMSGILLATTIGLDVGVLTLLIVQAFGAAAIGAFSSLPLTYAGGLAVGIAQALAVRYLAIHDVLRGLPSSLPFLVLFVVLLVTPKRRLIEPGLRLVRRLDVGLRIDRRVAVPALAAAAAGLLLVPQLVGPRLPVYTNALVYVILFASLGLLVRTSGQVSLCHLAFAATGAATFSRLAGAGIPFPLALLLAGLVAMPVGAVVAIPAIRLSGIFLAIATFGFGILVQQIFFTTFLMFGATNQLRVPRPAFTGDPVGDTGYYYVVLLVAAVCCVAVVLVQRSRLGRLLRALGDSPTALASHGTNTNVTRLYVFCISAFLAGIAGAASGPITGSTSGLSFDYSGSLILVAVLAIAGRRAIPSALIAAAAFAVAPSYIENATLSEYVPVFFGLAAIFASVTPLAGIGPKLVASRRAAAREGRSRRRDRAALALDGTP